VILFGRGGPLEFTYRDILSVTVPVHTTAVLDEYRMCGLGALTATLAISIFVPLAPNKVRNRGVIAVRTVKLTVARFTGLP
jgi:hypothetical protein